MERSLAYEPRYLIEDDVQLIPLFSSVLHMIMPKSPSVFSPKYFEVIITWLGRRVTEQFLRSTIKASDL